MKANLFKGSLGIGEAEYPVDILIINIDGNDITVVSSDNGTCIATKDIIQRLSFDDNSCCEVDLRKRLVEEIIFSVEVKNGALNSRAEKDLRNFINGGR